MSITATYPSHADARKAGWFSRRHQTDEAHRETRDRFMAERDERIARGHAQNEADRQWRHRRRLANVLAD